MTKNVKAANPILSLQTSMFTIFRMIKAPVMVMPADSIKKLDANLTLPQQAHVVGVDEIQGDSEHDGKKGENPSGQAPLSCMDTDLPLQAESLPDDVGGFVENLGEISSALLLNQNRGGYNSHVLQRNTGNKVIHGCSEFYAVVLFIAADLELDAYRIGRLAPTSPSAATRLWPARSALTIKLSASGSSSSNLLKRLLRLWST